MDNTLQMLDDLSNSNEPILAGVLGIVTPDTPTQRALFNKIVAMNLPQEEQAVYAELARAVADLKDAKDNEPMVQLQNPIRDELSYLFDRLK